MVVLPWLTSVGAEEKSVMMTGWRVSRMQKCPFFRGAFYDDQIIRHPAPGRSILASRITALEVPGLRPGTVIDRCRLVSRTDFMISAGIRKNSRPEIFTRMG